MGAWRWSSKGADELLQQVLGRALEGLQVATGYRDDDLVLRVSLSETSGLLLRSREHRGWKVGAHASVSYTVDVPQAGNPLHELAEELSNLSEQAVELLLGLAADNRLIDQRGAAAGTLVDAAATAERHEELRPFLRVFEGLYGEAVTSREIPASPGHLSLEFQTIARTQEKISFLGCVDSFAPGVRAHLAELGFGWREDFKVRVIPPPAVFSELADACPMATGLRGDLLIRDAFELPAREWVEAIMSGGFPVVVPATASLSTVGIPKLMGRLATLGLPIPPLLVSRSVALLHDMGLHVMATHAVPGEAIDDLRERFRRTVAQARNPKQISKDWARFMEGKFTATCVDLLGVSADIADFRDRFTAEYDELASHSPSI